MVSGQALVDVAVPISELPSLARYDEIQYVEEAPLGELRNDTVHWIVQSNIDGYDPLWNQGLHGEGMIAHLIDGRVNGRTFLMLKIGQFEGA